MSKRLWIITLACLPRLLFGTNGECLKYEPARVNLTGVLVSHQGLRNWWALKLDKPVCTISEPSDPAAVAHSKVEEIQLIVFGGQAEFERYKPLLGRKVSVSGKLTPRVTAYHQTPVLIMVESIESKDHTETPVIVSQRPAPRLPEIPEYSASATVVPHPVNRVIKQAWDKDPSHLFADSDRYIDHMFNGPMDIMWVRCRDGYEISNAHSSTASSVFQMAPDDPKNPYWGVAVAEAARTNITVRCSKAH
jgi:hypothetical protein